MNQCREPISPDSDYHGRPFAQQDRTGRDNYQDYAFHRHSPPTAFLGIPGTIDRIDEGDDTLDGRPQQEDKRNHTRLRAHVDHIGNGAGNGTLHFLTKREEFFYIGND